MLLDNCDQELYDFYVNPGSLNRWLQENGCFNNDLQIKWGCTDKLSSGVKFLGVVSTRDSIRSNLDRGNLALLRVSDEPHYVLAYGYKGSSFNVLDPRGDRLTYDASEVIEGIIHTVPYWCHD